MNIQNIFGGFSDLLTPAAGTGINITNLFIFENNEAAEGFLKRKKYNNKIYQTYRILFSLFFIDKFR